MADEPKFNPCDEDPCKLARKRHGEAKDVHVQAVARIEEIKDDRNLGLGGTVVGGTAAGIGGSILRAGTAITAAS